MKNEDIRNHIDSKIELVRKDIKNVDDKMDSLSNRIVKTENDVRWMHGHLKYATGFAITIISSIVVWYLTKGV